MKAGVARIAMGWVASPLIAAVIGAALLAFLRARIHHAPDRIAAAMRWLPRVVGAGAAVLAAAFPVAATLLDGLLGTWVWLVCGVGLAAFLCYLGVRFARSYGRR